MRDLNECRAEIFRRSQERIRERKNKFKKILTSSVCFCLAMLCAVNLFFNGGLRLNAEDLMRGIRGAKIEKIEDLSRQNAAVTDFAVRLLKAAYTDDDNTLISPLSVLSALAMVSNGVDGETLEEMEEVFGMTREDLNLYLYSYISDLPQGRKYKLKLANSLWITEDENFTVNRDFLQTNADYYSADVYKAPFDDSTLKDINDWVNDRTDGMIPEILDDLPNDAVMYLINALSFEAEWQEIYDSDQVDEDVFTKEDGTEQLRTFMRSGESKYLGDKSATGFIKYYAGGRYAFAALLPRKGMSVEKYLDTLDGESLNDLLVNALDCDVSAYIPKFESGYTVELSEVLKNMGINVAFDQLNADFESLGSYADGNIYIGRILHKTNISVAEKGTKAGAATAVEVLLEANARYAPKVVKLNRPFVYMLIDCENNIPFFIGAMMGIGQ